MADIVTMPKLGFDMAEGTLVRWVLAEGEEVQKGSILAEIETDKATVEVESTYAGVVLRHLVPQGEIVPVNAPIAVIGESGEVVDIDTLVGETSEPDGVSPQETKQDIPEPEMELAQPPEADTQLPEGLRASPLARRMANELKIDMHKVKGSGPGGRITKKDIQSFQESLSKAAPLVGIPPASALSTPAISATGPVPETTYVPITKLRSIIARRMVEATQQVPHFFVTHDYDVKVLMEYRSQINALLPDDEKISVNDFIIKAVSLALLEFPNLNASIDLANDRLVQHPQVNVGVAVAVPNGLLTVVCKDAVRKTLRQIASEVRTLVGRAREGKVRPEDIEGSTFTVSNLGMFDVEQFTAIINPPEAAILAVGSVRQVPVLVGGEIQPGTRMKVTLSVDHRVSDGAEGARFLQLLGEFLEAPIRLLI